jgi:YHS domain-containing protein
VGSEAYPHGLAHLLTKGVLAMTEDWELSFLPLDDPRAIHPPRLFNICHQCGVEHPYTDTITHTIYRGHNRVSVYHFCSDSCKVHFARGQQAKLDFGRKALEGYNG